MRPFTRTIIELFDSKRRYLIPLYQRQYAWKVEPQLEYLWQDVARIAKGLIDGKALSAPHFMGAIVIAQVKTYGKQVQAFEVIDGQQRLTTFQLLLIAFRRVSKKYDPEYADEVEKYIFNSGVMEEETIEKYKLWPSRVDRPAFEAIALGQQPPTPGDLPSVAMKAEAFFFEEIGNFVNKEGAYDNIRLEKLYEALKSGLAVVSIELETHDDPQTIFETLNSRGVDLAVGDLIRNFIFQRAVGLGQAGGVLTIDYLYEQYWLPLDSWFWKEEDTRGRLTRSRLDWLLFDRIAMNKAEIVSAEHLYEVYRKWMIQQQPFDGVKEELEAITRSAATFRRILTGDGTDRIGAFGRFSKAFDVSTTMPLILFLVENLDEAELCIAFGLIQSYITRRDICGLATGNYNRFFIDAVKFLRANEATVMHLKKFLSAGEIDTTRWPGDAEFNSAWMGRPQYKSARQQRLKYVLEQIDFHKRTKFDEIVEVKGDLTLEHIMPQKWRENWPLTDANGQNVDASYSFESMEQAADRDTKVQCLGNLTLLTQALNGSVSNGSFAKKMPSIKAQASLKLNRELQDYDSWNEGCISARGKNLFDVACILWPSSA